MKKFDPELIKEAVKELHRNPKLLKNVLNELKSDRNELQKALNELRKHKEEVKKAFEDPIVREQLRDIIKLLIDDIWFHRFMIDLFMIMMTFMEMYLPFLFGPDFFSLSQIGSILGCCGLAYTLIGWSAVAGLITGLFSSAIFVLACAYVLPQSFIIGHVALIGALSKIVAILAATSLTNKLNRPTIDSVLENREGGSDNSSDSSKSSSTTINDNKKSKVYEDQGYDDDDFFGR